MTVPPHSRVLDDTLADGEWHDYHQVIDAMAAAVPPGRAFRTGERHRREQHTRRTGDASTGRQRGDETTAVATGGRLIARQVIRSRRVCGSVQERTVDGRRQIRRVAR